MNDERTVDQRALATLVDQLRQRGANVVVRDGRAFMVTAGGREIELKVLVTKEARA